MASDRREDRLHVHAWRPHALRGLREHVETEHGDREEGRRWRRKLHRQLVLQQAFGSLIVGGHRQVGQPRRHRLRFVARGHTIEVALRKRRRVEEVRLLKIREPDFIHTATLVAHAHRPALADANEPRHVDEVTVGAGTGDFLQRCARRAY